MLCKASMNFIPPPLLLELWSLGIHFSVVCRCMAARCRGCFRYMISETTKFFSSYVKNIMIFHVVATVHGMYGCENIERHTTDTIVSWPNPKQWVIVHTSDLMMIIRKIYNLSIITTEMGKLKTYSPTYCIMDNGDNMLNLTHTLDKIYLTGIL